MAETTTSVTPVVRRDERWLVISSHGVTRLSWTDRAQAEKAAAQLSAEDPSRGPYVVRQRITLAEGDVLLPAEQRAAAVECLAKSMYMASRRVFYHDSWERNGELTRERFRDLARAALAAVEGLR